MKHEIVSAGSFRDILRTVVRLGNGTMKIVLLREEDCSVVLATEAARAGSTAALSHDVARLAVVDYTGRLVPLRAIVRVVERVFAPDGFAPLVRQHLERLLAEPDTRLELTVHRYEMGGCAAERRDEYGQWRRR